MKKVLSAFLSFFALSSISFAADPNGFFSPETMSVNPQISSAAVSIGYIIQLAFSLAVIMGLIYLTAKYILPKIQPASKSKYIELFDKIVVEPQVTLYIVKCFGKSWLISVSNKQVSLIDKIEEDLLPK